MPTILGAILMLWGVILFFRKGNDLFGLTFFSSLFGASSLIAAKNFGIQPYFGVAFLLILQTIVRKGPLKLLSGKFIGKRPMLIFLLIAVISALTCPLLFARIPVYDPYVGIDLGLFNRTPLHLATANYTQCVYVTIDVLVVLCAAINFGSARRDASLFYFSLTFYTLAGVVFLQALFGTVHLTFPYEFFQTHGGYVLQGVTGDAWVTRYPGTFGESSAGGAVLATFTAGYLVRWLRTGEKLLPLIVGVVATLIVRSSASMVSICVLVPLILVSEKVYRFPFTILLKPVKRILSLSAFAGIVFLAVVLSPLRESVLDFTVNKQDSYSYLARVASDDYALQLVKETYGIGVGMGSNRPSSLLTSLLSTVGVLGFIAFLVLSVRLVRSSGKQNTWLQWGSLALLIDLCAGGPDYYNPWLWSVFGFAVLQGVRGAKGFVVEKKAVRVRRPAQIAVTG